MEEIREKEIDLVELYLAEIGNVEPLSEAEKATLPRLLKEKDPDAMDRMAWVYVTKVVDIAREYMDLEESRRFETLDLIQDGNNGLIEAVKTHDWDHPEDFPAYVRDLICEFIERGILYDCSHNYGIRHITEKILNREMAELQKMAVDFGPEPDTKTEPSPDYPETLQSMLDAPADSHELRQYLARNGVIYHDLEWPVMILRLGLEGNAKHCRKDISKITGFSMLRIDLIEKKLYEPINRLRYLKRRQERLERLHPNPEQEE